MATLNKGTLKNWSGQIDRQCVWRTGPGIQHMYYQALLSDGWHVFLFAVLLDYLWAGLHNPCPGAWPSFIIKLNCCMHSLHILPHPSLTVHHYYSVPVFTLQQNYLHCSLNADLAQCGYVPPTGSGSTANSTVLSANRWHQLLSSQGHSDKARHLSPYTERHYWGYCRLRSCRPLPTISHQGI